MAFFWLVPVPTFRQSFFSGYRDVLRVRSRKDSGPFSPVGQPSKHARANGSSLNACSNSSGSSGTSLEEYAACHFPLVFAAWIAAKPASVIRPAAIKASARLRLTSDHTLPGLRGVMRMMKLSLSRLYILPSIQPKQSASSTASASSTPSPLTWAFLIFSQI